MLEQYQKPSLSHEEQLQLLKDRGLLVENDTKALYLLRHIIDLAVIGFPSTNENEILWKG
jgi:abortive infection bacteriophage resistance protein